MARVGLASGELARKALLQLGDHLLELGRRSLLLLRHLGQLLGMASLDLRELVSQLLQSEPRSVGHPFVGSLL